MIFEFEVEMIDVGVPVRRRIQMDSNSTFNELHKVIQVAFEWQNSHLYSFSIERTNGESLDSPVEIEPPKEEDNIFSMISIVESYDDEEEILSDWFKIVEDSVIYTYDFGDNWEHHITLAKILKPEKEQLYPRCVDALHLAPKEDSRYLIMTGRVDLEYTNSKGLVKYINENLNEILPELISKVEYEDTYTFEDVLSKAKEFHKLKPWNKMADEEIFIVQDPKSGEPILCSVMGAGGEMFGLAMYIGVAGIQTALDILDENYSENDMMLNQRSVILSYENRDDLDKWQYNLIKSHDISFRGKKAWPTFTSYKPGYFPWRIDEEELRLVYFALEQAIEVYKEYEKDESKMINLLQEGKILSRIPQKIDDDYKFENGIVKLEDLLTEDEATEAPLAVSEIEVKRVNKLLKPIPVTLEIGFEFVNTPIQEQSNQRPFFPIIVLALEYEEKEIVFQRLIEDHDLETLQYVFLDVFEELGGIPERLLTDLKTAIALSPLAEKLNIAIQTEGYEPTIKSIMEEISNLM